MSFVNIVTRILPILALIAIVGWGIWFWVKNSSDPRSLINKLILTAILLAVCVATLCFCWAPLWPPVAAVFAIIIGAIWTSSIAETLLRPLIGSLTGEGDPPDPAPLYSIAESKRRHGEFAEAIRLIREQLELFPDDFNGLMLVATIQAENMKDIQGAELTINHLLSTRLGPQTASAALSALADWHLRTEDPEAAQADLQRIITMFPNTPVSQIAHQRISHIASKDEMEAMRHRGPIALPKGHDNMGLRADVKASEEEDPAQIADGYVRQLKLHPQDNETREKLAMLYLDFTRGRT